jgi:phosphatidylglycerophosphate synthase
MLDARARALLARPIARVAGWLDRPWVTPGLLTTAGLLTGLGAAGAAAGRVWIVALVLWLVSRAFDGLDGPLARRRSSGTADPFGGFADIVADFTVYGTFIVGVAVGTGAYLPFLVVLLAYYINGASLLALSSLADHVGRHPDDGRSVFLAGGLAEGTETIISGVVFTLLPGYAGLLGWVWAVLVFVTAGGRVLTARRVLTDTPARGETVRP